MVQVDLNNIGFAIREKGTLKEFEFYEMWEEKKALDEYAKLDPEKYDFAEVMPYNVTDGDGTFYKGFYDKCDATNYVNELKVDMWNELKDWTPNHLGDNPSQWEIDIYNKDLQDFIETIEVIEY